MFKIILKKLTLALVSTENVAQMFGSTSPHVSPSKLLEGFRLNTDNVVARIQFWCEPPSFPTNDYRGLFI